MLTLLACLATVAAVHQDAPASTAKALSFAASVQARGNYAPLTSSSSSSAVRRLDLALDAADDLEEDISRALKEDTMRTSKDLRWEQTEDDIEANTLEVEEGRGRSRRTKLSKKVDGTVLSALLALKMAPLMFISTKMAVLSFMVQLKSLFLTLVSTAIAAVQFFWRVQEKRQRGNIGHPASLGVSHGVGVSGAAAGWAEPTAWPDRRKYISF